MTHEGYAGDRPAGKEDMDEAALLGLLARHHIPVEQWGKGQAKTVGHLLREVAAGQSILRELDGELVREVHVLWADVMHVAGDGGVFLLREAYQELIDDSDRRIRTRTLPASIGEKIVPGEDPGEAAARALRKKLDIESFVARYELTTSERLQPADSYPGLNCLYRDMQTVLLLVGDEHFRPEGYVGEQPGKNSYFVWTELTQPNPAGEEQA